MKIIYHYSYSFADSISPEIVKRIAKIDNIESINNFEIYNTKKTKKNLFNGYILKVNNRVNRTIKFITNKKKEVQKNKRLFALGSIFHQAKHSDIIWGTGINSKWQPLEPPKIELDIRAVRGPLSRNFLIEQYGWTCPEVYGDPALLLPILFQEYKPNPKYEYTVLFQHFDEPYIKKYWERYKNYNIYLCQKPNRIPWQKVVQRILESNFIISSSLHGIIIAEAYGIPARWLHNPFLPSSLTEVSFKYNDYYLSTGRKPNQFAMSIEESLEMGGLEPISKFDTKKLIDSFPKEYFLLSKK